MCCGGSSKEEISVQDKIYYNISHNKVLNVLTFIAIIEVMFCWVVNKCERLRTNMIGACAMKCMDESYAR